MAAPPNEKLLDELVDKIFNGTLDETEMFKIWDREQAEMLLKLPDGEKNHALYQTLTREQKIRLFANKSNSWASFQNMIFTAKSLFIGMILQSSPTEIDIN